MRRIICFALLSLLALTGSTRAGGLIFGCKPQCTPIPPPPCCDCGDPCEHRLHLTPFGPEHAQKLICSLQSGTCCERIAAVRKLGNRMHADFCCDPCVLDALLRALLVDSCWEVRKAAAWSLFGQGARVEQALLALYISSKLDPHYVVRDRAAEALDLLTLCRKECYKPLYTSADRLIAELKKVGYKPGHDDCQILFNQACGVVGVTGLAPAPAVAVQPAPKVVHPEVKPVVVTGPHPPRGLTPTVLPAGSAVNR
jgi:hypothetical protein